MSKIVNLETDYKLKPGTIIPVINRNRCEGKAECLEVCPYNVFELRLLTQTEKERLSRVGRFKLRVHRGKQAFPTRGDLCQGCSYFVKNCPEKDITL